jgi:hypothetical protein
MRLKFFWIDDRSPCCEVTPAGPFGYPILGCILGDDGGLRLSTSIKDLEDGVRRVDAVLQSATPLSLDWDRETWGATIQANKVKLYSLHDENYAEFMATPAFRKALFQWWNFVGAGPVDDPQFIEVEA